MRFTISRSSDQHIPGAQPLPEAVLVGNEWLIDLEPANILALAERLQLPLIVRHGEPPQVEIYDDSRE